MTSCDNFQTVQRTIKAFIDENGMPRRWTQRRRREPDPMLDAVDFVKASLAENADEIMASFLTNPSAHINDDTVITDRREREFCSYLAAEYVSRNPSDIAAQLLVDRLEGMFANSFEPGEIKELSYSRFCGYNFEEFYHFPRARDTFSLLMRSHYAFPQVMRFVDKLLNDEYLQTRTFEDYPDGISNYKLLIDDAYTNEFTPYFRHLHQQGSLNAGVMTAVARHFPNGLDGQQLYDDSGPDTENFPDSNDRAEASFLNKYRICLKQTAIDLCGDIESNANSLKQIFEEIRLNGLQWLQFALIEISNKQLKSSQLKDSHSSGQTLRYLIGIEGLEPDQSDEQLDTLIASFDKKVLKLALPHARFAKRAIRNALGMPDFTELDAFFDSLGSNSWNEVVENCADPENGVIDLARLRQATHGISEKQIADYLKLQANAYEASKNTRTLVSAACGIDRSKIEKGLVRHGQTAIKAFGLCPIEDSADVKQRYLKFKSMHKEASQYGQERQANTRAAVAAGLANLAQVAGYTDVTRMEWALEADLAKNAIALEHWHDALEWQISLVIDGISPRIAVRKGEKTLKSVPPKVRKEPIYQSLRDAQDQIRGQTSRFKSTLQEMMCRGEPIEQEELATLKSLPVVATLLSRLILQTPSGETGLFVPGTGQLLGLTNDSIEIDGPVKLAHPLDLYQNQSLAAWQRRVVEKQIVQPFKQAFRELYLVTPAEIDAQTTSRRFDGHVVDAAIASRLFQTRDWQLGGYEDGAQCTKSLVGFDLRAEIEFHDVGHYFAETDQVTMGEIHFYQGRELVRMDEIDPLAFSEVMRDADLVAGVAQVTDDDQRWSTEVAVRRAELIGALIETMGMTQVCCDDKFARVKGQLASYRIHLGSGVIHVEPGNYLCIVPAREKEDESIYLPFADADRKMREIISKVLMLSNDDKIKDQSILGQIRRSDAALTA